MAPLVEIYTKEGCSQCETAKRMMREKNVEFTEYVVGKDVTREAVIAKFPQQRMVPIIMMDGKQITHPEQFQLLLEG